MKNVIIAILMFFSIPLALIAQHSNHQLSISQLTGDFYIFTTYQVYKGNRFPSNGMYLVTQNGVVMIDTPWDSTQFQPLLDSIKLRHNQQVVMCIATHSHEDRTGGLEFYKEQGIKTYSTQKTDDLFKERNESRASFILSGDTVFSIGEYSFQTFYGGEGHTPDNIVIWFSKEKILYGGCLVKSSEANDLGNLADANINAWPGTIRNIQHQFGVPEYVIPGHQSWKSKHSLDHTLKLLKQYEEKKSH